MDIDVKNYTYELRYPKTLNAALNELAQGHAGTVIPMELEKPFMELMQDRWFFQWPLVKYMYAHILITGYWVRDNYYYQTTEREGEDKYLALEILLPMADAGLATAQYDVATHFCFGDDQFEEMAKRMLEASKQDYPPAVKKLSDFLALGKREKLSIETLKEICVEVARTHIDDYSREFALKLLEKLEKNPDGNAN